jgi:hypothetical protein
MGGSWSHPLGSDELGRVCSRAHHVDHRLLLIAFFGTP